MGGGLGRLPEWHDAPAHPRRPVTRASRAPGPGARAGCTKVPLGIRDFYISPPSWRTPRIGPFGRGEPYPTRPTQSPKVTLPPTSPRRRRYPPRWLPRAPRCARGTSWPRLEWACRMVPRRPAPRTRWWCEPRPATVPPPPQGPCPAPWLGRPVPTPPTASPWPGPASLLGETDLGCRGTGRPATPPPWWVPRPAGKSPNPSVLPLPSAMGDWRSVRDDPRWARCVWHCAGRRCQSPCREGRGGEGRHRGRLGSIGSRPREGDA